MMTDLTKYLSEVKERADQATDGPWKHELFKMQESILAHTNKPILMQIIEEGEDYWEPNLTFIAHARTDIPKLLAIVDAYKVAYTPLQYTDPGGERLLNLKLDKIARGEHE